MKRKFVSIFLIATLIFSFNFSSVFATDAETDEENTVWEDGGITFTLDAEGTLTVSGAGETPDYYWWDDKYSPVYNNEIIKKIIIEEGITRLGDEIFKKCTKVEEVSFPSTLTSLGDQAFAGCESLPSVEIPNNVTEFGYLVFDDCRGMKEFIVDDNHPTLSVDEEGVLFNKDKTVLLDYPGAKTNQSYDVPVDVEEIYHYAFDESKNLQSVNLPYTLRTIGDEAFFECTGLTKIDVPEGVERIGGGAFQKCSNLNEISLPTSLRFLNSLVFQGTAYYNNMENWENYVLYIDTILVAGKYLDEDYDCYEPSGDLVIKEGTTLIAGESFGLNMDLISVSFPESLQHICQGAFYGCDGLVTVDLPKSLQTLDDTAFYLCGNLSQVTMGTQLTYIGYSVFEDTIYQNNINNYIDGILYNNGNLIVAGDTITAECAIKNDTRLIAARAFEGKTNLTKITIPESVKYIGVEAFSACDGLKNVEVPATVETIKDKAFGYDYYYDWNADKEVYTKYGDFTISGYVDTEAHRYALANDITFINLAENSGEDEEDSAQPSVCNHENEVAYPYVPKTCTEPGYQFGTYCGDCGETIIEREVLEPVGHFEATLLPVSATCTKSGLGEGKKCSVCHEVLVPQEVIPAGCKLETKLESQATIADDGKLVTKCSVCGKDDSEEVIGQAVVTLSQDTFVYDGQQKSAEVIVKDRFGNDISTDNYRITTSSGRVDVGQYTYNINFCNRYAGYAVLTMKINPAGTTIQQTWSDSTAIDVMITQVEADNTNVTGYELRYSTTEDFSKDVKTVQTDNTYNIYQTFNNLQPNTAYYFQVRTYKKLAGEYYYSDWSDTAYRMTKAQSPYVPPVVEPEEPIIPDTPAVPETPVCKAHKWDAGAITTAASCKVEGKKTYHCQNAGCSGLKTEVIPAKGHQHQQTLAGAAPTCTKTGLTEGKKCTDCGTVTVEQTIIAKLPHTVATTEIKKATLKSGGQIVEKCTCGEVVKKTAISKIRTVKLSKTAAAYTGKAQKVKVTVKDAAGNTIKAANYTVTYKNNKKVGKATVTVKFKGNYSGTKKLTFKINPKAPTIKKPVAAKRAVTVKWSKVTKESTGYEVMAATNKKFTKGKKNVTIKKSKITSKKITKLNAKKTYYVKVRTYKTVKGVKYYSAWSAVKKVKTK